MANSPPGIQLMSLRSTESTLLISGPHGKLGPPDPSRHAGHPPARCRRASFFHVFAALGTQGLEAVEVARAIGGVAFVAHDGQREPAFGALVIGPDRDAVESLAAIGLYQVQDRPMRHHRRFWPPGSAS